jgi:sugar lactone lactonase YvrE
VAVRYASALWTDQGGSWQATELDSPSNGLWFLPDGRLAAAMMHEKRIGVWTGGRFTTYADLGTLAAGPLGDLVGDRRGNLYVDDVGTPSRSGRLLRVATDGTATVVAQDLDFPNGLAFLDDERTLVVAETSAQRLTAFTVAADGTLHDRRLYADIASLVGSNARPDGIWATPEGVWVATTTGHTVALVRDDRLVTAIDAAPAFPIACCGDGAGRLFVTLADTAGRPLLEAVAAQAVRATVMVTEPAVPEVGEATIDTAPAVGAEPGGGEARP